TEGRWLGVATTLGHLYAIRHTHRDFDETDRTAAETMFEQVLESRTDIAAVRDLAHLHLARLAFLQIFPAERLRSLHGIAMDWQAGAWSNPGQFVKGMLAMRGLLPKNAKAEQSDRALYLIDQVLCHLSSVSSSTYPDHIQQVLAALLTGATGMRDFL